jgi:hypothetical protein
MKKAILTVLAMVIMAFPALAFEGAQGSAVLTEDGAAATGANVYITALTVITDGTNNATVVLYDSASAASGTVIAELWVPGALISDRQVWTFPRKVSAGIYADLTGTGASCIVEYMRK